MVWLGRSKLFVSATLFLVMLASAAKLDSAITAWDLAGNVVYLGTEAGGVFRYLVEEDRLDLIWRLPELSLVTGNTQPKVYSIDYANGSLLWVRDGRGGSRVVEELKVGGSPRVVISDALKLPIVSAWHLENGGILLVLLDGEVLWASSDGEITDRLQITHSAVGAAVYNGRVLAVGDEGGVVTLVDVGGKQIAGRYPLQRDKVLTLALGQHRLVSGGRDRRAVAMDLETGSSLKLKAQFFVMNVALDPLEKLVAYNYDEGGTIRIVDLEARREVVRKSGFPGLNKLMFLNENELLVTDDMGNLQTWRWK